MAQAPRSVRFEVDGLIFEALEWGAGTPVLALHGWMDHAGSFAELAPLLDGCHVVALDLSGQGMSSHRSAHASYNIWDDLPQIAGVIAQLGWDDCILLGHSRGANIAALFAAALPEKVRGLISLDSLAPEPSTSSVVETLRGFVLETGKQVARGPRTFADRDAYLSRRSARGSSPEVSEKLADRALDTGPEGLRLRGDPRHFASSAVRLGQRQVEEVLRAIACPMLVIWGSDGLLSRRPATADLAHEASGLIGDFKQHEVPGDHHFHLSPEGAAEAAAIIAAFLDRKALR